MDSQVELLEERVAHLMRSVEDLSDVVAKQADAIDLLTRRVALLLERTAAPDEGGAVFTDERPPHW